MKHIHFFQFNVPAHNHIIGRTDFYLNVISEWDGSFYTIGIPMVFSRFIELANYDLVSVKDWSAVVIDVSKLATKHFAEFARQKQIEDAKAVLALNDNPVFDRLNTSNYSAPVY